VITVSVGDAAAPRDACIIIIIIIIVVSNTQASICGASKSSAAAANLNRPAIYISIYVGRKSRRPLTTSCARN
jgi:hypothetical protein